MCIQYHSRVQAVASVRQGGTNAPLCFLYLSFRMKSVFLCVKLSDYYSHSTAGIT